MAELRPARSETPPPADAAAGAALEALEGAGEVQSARLPAADWAWRPAGAGLPPGTADGLLESLREDR